MLGHDGFLLLGSVPTFPCHGPVLPAYVGLGPGQELIPYFFALLGLVGTALLAVLQRPIAFLLRVLARVRHRPAPGSPAPLVAPDAAQDVGNGPATDGAAVARPAAAGVPEDAGEGTPDKR